MFEKGHHHISGIYCYQSKKRSYGDKRSEVNFYQNDRISSKYDRIFIFSSYVGNWSDNINSL